MMTRHELPQDRPAFASTLKASGVIGSILAAGLVATGLAAFDSAQTHQAVAVHTEASHSIAPTTNVGRSGTMVVYETLW